MPAKKTPAKTSTTSTRKSSSRRKTTPASTANKPAAPVTTESADAPTTPKKRAPARPKAPVVVAKTIPVSVGPELKKQELLEKVVRQSGASKRDVKPIVEAMLDILGSALSEGRPLNLEPFGKTKITRVKETGRAKVSVLRVRQKAPQPPLDEKDSQDPLAQPAQ